MSKEPKLTEWSKENPPFIGEYNASVSRSPDTLRWWDGELWSLGYRQADSDLVKHYLRRAKRSTVREMEWRGMAKKPKGFAPPEPLKG